MKKVFFALTVITSFALACQNEKTVDNTGDSVALDSAVSSNSPQACYQYIKNKDTAKMMLVTSGTVTTGELAISLWEKDANNGKIKGELKGDTLIADYTFNSEGTESVREVAFIKRGDQFIEGYGDVETKGNKVVFKNRAALKFGQGIVFTKVDCN